VVWYIDFHVNAGSACLANNLVFGDFPIWAIGALTD